MEREASSSDSDLVTLDIEGTKIHCIRKDLTENSDYFLAMFEGDFLEKNQSVITIKEVKPEAMKIIHKLLYDAEFTISENDIFSVLQAACMLQFLKIRRICLKQVETYMRPDNCMSIWILAEHLDLKEIYYKAKLLSLLEFSFIKNSEKQYFLELDLDLILSYLGNVNLQCTNEFHVYEMLSTWYENCETKNEDTLRKLLHCVNYTTLTGEEMDIIINSQCITQFEAITDCLKCVKALKNGDDLFSFKDEYVELANKLLSAKDRNFSGLPCTLFDNAQGNIPRSAVLYFDLTSQTWKKLFATGVTEKLHGFKMLGYKNFVLIFGGELGIEQDVWSYDFYIYDIIKETWTKKRLPHARRHFESCVCGDKVFIVGGMGPQGVIEKNMFWYDFVTGEFSSLESLPQPIRQIRCCQFQDELFVLNFKRKEGHIFNSQSRKWTTLKIVDLREIPFLMQQITVFSYRKCIYVRFSFPANSLYEMKINDGKLVTNAIELPQIRVSFVINGDVFIADTLYTLSRSGVIYKSKVSLELLNINTREHSKCFQKKMFETLDADGEKFWFTSSDLAFFGLFHPDLVMKNDFINVW